MIGIRELVDVLEERLGLRGLGSKVQARRREILEGLKPRNFLASEEVEKVNAILKGIRLPSPKCWGDALAIHGVRGDIEGFSPDRTYCCKCLRSLISTLRGAGLSDEAILRKLEEAAERAERYRVYRCVYPREGVEDCTLR